MAKVAILTTGGTIASRPGAGRMAHGDEVLSTVPGLRDAAEIVYEEFCVVASSQMTPRMMYSLARRAGELLAGDIDGVVITHGTDTMEETVYMLDMVVPGEKPVVITGAMRTADEVGADGARNLLEAVQVAASPDARSRGAMLVLNDEIHLGRWVAKVHSSNPRAFGSPVQGRAGEVHGSKPVFYVPPSPRRPVSADDIVTEVDLIKLCAGADDRLVKACVAGGAQGVVVEVMGKGNVPRGILPGLEECREAGVPVVMVSRCQAGPVEIGRLEERFGCINGGELSGLKARLRLMLALGAVGKDRGPERIRQFFE
jgi:L-asparaginase